MKPGAMTFFGNFGTRNLGNECTLEAILQNLRRLRPDTPANCVCPDPDDTSARHGIPAFLMSYRYSEAFKPGAASHRQSPVVRLIRRLVLRMPHEILEWIKAFRRLGGTSSLVMPGTGMLGDFGIGPLDLHYEILKWVLLARLRGCKVLFVSVGAGPIDHPLSRWMVKAALSLADYRSYRDPFSRQYLESIGCDTSRDLIYPDLVFSLPRSATSVSPQRAGTGRVVGLGLMGYYGRHRSPEAGERIFRDYVEKLARFAAWLLDRKYSVRLLIGDSSYDRSVKGDLRRALDRTGATYDPVRIIDEPIDSPEQLVAQLAQTDLVVATRFHNILLALMLAKPVVALSYHEKIPSLMSAMGMAEYCQDIETLDVQRLTEQFSQLDGKAAVLAASFKEKTEEFRSLLDEQYGRIFLDL